MSEETRLKLQVHLVNITWQTVFLEQRILRVPTSPVQAMNASRNNILFPDYTIDFTYLALLNIPVLTPLASGIFHQKRREGRTKPKNPYFWRDSSVLEIIKDEVYLGFYYYNKTKGDRHLKKSEWKLSPFSHAEIIDKGTFALAQMRIKEDVAFRNSRKTADNHLYILSGLLKCHACYDPYSDRDPLSWSGTSKIKNDKRMYYYQCGGKNTKKHPVVCKALPFPAKEIEQFVSDFIKDLLSDPKSVYNHINSLQSTKSLKKQLKQNEGGIIEQLNDLPRYRQALKHQHENGHLTDAAFDEKIKKAAKNEAQLKKDLVILQGKIGEENISEIYTRTFNQFAKKYKAFIDGTLQDRQEISNLIHLLIDRINIYARKKTTRDKIAGKKTENQLIPYQVRIDLRLPQDIMQRFAHEGKFEVKTPKL